MEWLSSLVGDAQAVQLILITLVLVAILIAVFWFFRKIAGSPGRRAIRNRVIRLAVTDSAAVDDRRYLVLVRRDNVEHLVMIGGPTDIVIESNIVRANIAQQRDRLKSNTQIPANAVDENNLSPAPMSTSNSIPADTPTKEPKLTSTSVAPASTKQPDVEATTQPVAASALPVAGVTAAVLASATLSQSAETSHGVEKVGPANFNNDELSSTSQPETIAQPATSDLDAMLSDDIEKQIFSALDIDQLNIEDSSDISKSEPGDPKAEALTPPVTLDDMAKDVKEQAASKAEEINISQTSMPPEPVKIVELPEELAVSTAPDLDAFSQSLESGLQDAISKELGSVSTSIETEMTELQPETAMKVEIKAEPPTPAETISSDAILPQAIPPEPVTESIQPVTTKQEPVPDDAQIPDDAHLTPEEEMQRLLDELTGDTKSSASR